MKTTQFSLLTGSVLTIALALIAIVIVPSSAWTPLAVASFVLVLASFGSTWGVPLWLAMRHRSSAATIATLGPSGVILGTAVAVAIAAFLLSLTSFNKLALAAFIGTVAVWVSGVLTLAYTGATVSAVNDDIDLTRETGLLVSALSELSVKTSDGASKVRLSRNVEFIKYGQTPHPDGASLTNALLVLLQKKPAEGELDEFLSQLEEAAERRKSALLRARSRI